MSINKFNSEGYYDPTTYEALTNIHRKEKITKFHSEIDKSATYRPLVYVCSPFAGDVETNIKNARAFCRFAITKNCIPFAPHLLFPQFMNDSNKKERELAMHFNYVLLGKCNELWVFGGVVSKGMAYEIGVAKKRRMKIKWFNSKLEEVPEYD